MFRSLILGGICALCACNALNNSLPKPDVAKSVGNSPKTDAPSMPAVTLEIYTIPVLPYQADLLCQLWQEIDEQVIPPQLRRNLLVQGFRAGILGNLLSPALAQFLNISGNAQSPITAWGEMQEFSAADAANKPGAARQLQSLWPEMRALIKIYGDDTPIPECVLFWNDNGTKSAQTYKDALGLFCVSAVPNRDGSAQLKIVPELEHGVPEQRFRSVSGMMIQERGRPRRTFESLTLSQRLLPGQWLIIGAASPEAAGAGKSFFFRKFSELEQRFLALRLVSAVQSASPLLSNAPAPANESATAMPERN